jgi:KDO2-lipid IV(A) lauroyltransferase
VLEANLRRVVGPEMSGKELRALSRAGMSSYARYWFEVFRLPVISAERLVIDMRCEGEDRLLGTLAAGRGAVLALPHMGNWDQAGAWVIARGVTNITTVAERLEPESLARRFFAFREGLGFEVLPATGGVSRFGVLAQRLREGGLVCLLADRDVTGGGIEVDFFGEKAHMMGGAAALAVQTGAPLMPVTLWFDGPLWCAHIHEEIPVPEGGTRREKVAAMTQEVARVFEAGIAAHPEDWHMLQRVFTADLDLARLAAAEARAQAAGAGAEVAEAEAGAGQAPTAGAGGGPGRAALNGQAASAGPNGPAGGGPHAEAGGGPHAEAGGGEP